MRDAIIDEVLDVSVSVPVPGGQKDLGVMSSPIIVKPAVIMSILCRHRLAPVSKNWNIIRDQQTMTSLTLSYLIFKSDVDCRDRRLDGDDDSITTSSMLCTTICSFHQMRVRLVDKVNEHSAHFV